MEVAGRRQLVSDGRALSCQVSSSRTVMALVMESTTPSAARYTSRDDGARPMDFERDSGGEWCNRRPSSVLRCRRAAGCRPRGGPAFPNPPQRDVGTSGKRGGVCPKPASSEQTTWRRLGFRPFRPAVLQPPVSGCSNRLSYFFAPLWFVCL